MSEISDKKIQEAQEYIEWKWLVIVERDYGDRKRGDIVGRYNTYAAANRRAKQNYSMLSAVEYEVREKI